MKTQPNPLALDILHDLGEPFATHVMILLGRIKALEVLLDMLWTNEFAKLDNLLDQAKDFKDEALGLVLYDPDDPIGTVTYDGVEARLDSIINRVASLDDGPEQPVDES